MNLNEFHPQKSLTLKALLVLEDRYDKGYIDFDELIERKRKIFLRRLKIEI